MTKQELDARKRENLQMISGLRLLDDDFVRMVFAENAEADELVLRSVLERGDL